MQGLISKRRGKASNNQFPTLLKKQILSLLSTQYTGFGPTLACEKLQERNGITVSKETLRTWMQEAGLWQGKRRKLARVHPLRERRPCLGELVQIDGSPHDWFEGRREACCLLVFVDDATGRLQHLRFEEEETTFGYFAATRAYLNEHGRPLAFYSDKHVVFRVNKPESTTDSLTQFARAMKALGIEIICANTPQAKGRVERANGILQDRLVKELRLRNISDIQTANAFLPTFIADYNQRFAKQPRSPINAHRTTLPTPAALELIFCLHHTRKLSKNLELSYKNQLFQIQYPNPGYALRRATITVCEAPNGNIQLIYKGRTLNYIRYQTHYRTVQVIDAKSVNTRVNQLVAQRASPANHKPAAHHPWRQYERVAALLAARSSNSA